MTFLLLSGVSVLVAPKKKTDPHIVHRQGGGGVGCVQICVYVCVCGKDESPLPDRDGEVEFRVQKLERLRDGWHRG